MIGWLANAFKPSTAKSVEGEERPGPWATMAGWIPSSWGLNFWQQGHDPLAYGAGSAVVEACISAYAQTVAMCPGDHWKTNTNGGRERVTTSALSRILRQPNDYQSISDFLLNLTRHLYEHGEAFALAVRDNRNMITELHLMRSNMCGPRLAVDGSVFYSLGGNEIADRRFGPLMHAVPSRFVLHVRLHTPRHPLIGETPLLAAIPDVEMASVMKRNQTRFFMNGGRPSAVLTTDMPVSLDQSKQLRAIWDEQSKGMNQGGVPILGNGLKPQAWQQSNVDSQLAETLKLSDQAIALAFRVPLPILGLGGALAASTEALMGQWVASGLGFALNHIEEAIGNLFGLAGQPDEYLEFNTDALLRSAFKDRIEALAAGVIGGIYSPNEARRLEGLPDAVEGGEPRVQQQVVPLSYWKIQQDNIDRAAKAAEAAAKAPPPAAPTPQQDNKPPAADAASSAAKSYRTARRDMRLDA